MIKNCVFPILWFSMALVFINCKGSRSSDAAPKNLQLENAGMNSHYKELNSIFELVHLPVEYSLCGNDSCGSGLHVIPEELVDNLFPFGDTSNTGWIEGNTYYHEPFYAKSRIKMGDYMAYIFLIPTSGYMITTLDLNGRIVDCIDFATITNIMEPDGQKSCRIEKDSILHCTEYTIDWSSQKTDGWEHLWAYKKVSEGAFMRGKWNMKEISNDSVWMRLNNQRFLAEIP
jgi:hypothetical protein